jgi:hypothetical protein
MTRQDYNITCSIASMPATCLNPSGGGSSVSTFSSFARLSSHVKSRSCLDHSVQNSR